MLQHVTCPVAIHLEKLILLTTSGQEVISFFGSAVSKVQQWQLKRRFRSFQLVNLIILGDWSCQILWDLKRGEQNV